MDFCGRFLFIFGREILYAFSSTLFFCSKSLKFDGARGAGRFWGVQKLLLRARRGAMMDQRIGGGKRSR